VPPFDIQRLNAGGSLFLTRPALANYIATRDELEWRAAEILGVLADEDVGEPVGGLSGDLWGDLGVDVGGERDGGVSEAFADFQEGFPAG